MSEPAVISKREQKRQAKLAKEQKEKSLANGVESIDLAHGEVLPILGDDSSIPAAAAAASQTPFEPKKSPFVEPVQKRIRNYLKKKQKIDQLAERAKDPEAAKTLNKDQLETIARKDQVLAPLKELQNLAEQFTAIEQENNAAQETESQENQKTTATAVRNAKAEGLAEGRKIIASLTSFLNFASILRSSPTADKDFNDASERLLGLVYSGGEASVDAALKLHQGSSESIDDTIVAYKQIHEAILKQLDGGEQDDQTQEAELSEPGKESQQYSGSHFISLSDAANQPSSFGTGGISFLNESEIEDSHLPESIGEVTGQSPESVPPQTLASTEGNQAGNTVVDWSDSAAPRSNWADESSSDAPLPSAEVSDEMTPTTGGLRPLEDFKTIEKKPSVSREGGRGRGRGGRGRGEHRGGRGRGEHRGKSQAS